MVYNTFAPAGCAMSMHRSGREAVDGAMARPATFYPRIIREFDDGPDEQPMLYVRR